MLALGALLLTEILVVVVAEAVLWVRGIVGGKFAGCGAERSARLLLGLRLCGLPLALKSAFELVWRCRTARLLLLAERLKRLRGREG